MSLKAKLITGILSMMTVIIIISSIFSQVAISTLSDHTKNLTAGLSNDVSRDVSGFAEHYAGTLTYHETENVKDFIQSTIENAKRDLAILSSFQDLYSHDSGQVNTLFEKFMDQNETSQFIYVGTEQKTLSIYPRPEGIPSNYDPTSRLWYESAKKLEKGAYYITDAYLDGSEKEYMVTISTPLYRNNQFYGVLGIDISLAQLSTQIAKSKVGSTGYVILTDKSGSLLAYKDQELVQKSENISVLPIFKEQKNGVIYLDTDQVTYVNATEETTGWQIFSVIGQDEVKSFTNSISKNMSKQISYAENSISSVLAKLFTVQVIIIIVLLVVSILISIIFARYVVNPINKLSLFLKKVASGDLTEKVVTKSKDEMATLFSSVNNMVDRLRKLTNNLIVLIHQVEKDSQVLNEQALVTAHVSDTVTSALSEVSTGSEQLSADMVNISSNVEDNNQFVQQMTDTIEKVAQHARNTQSATSVGQSAMENMNKKINLIVNQSVQSTDIMKELNGKLQAINEITDLIHDIAEQTNLLSLNASIEAARAGEHGRGFAVVAQEVKKLAEQSSNSVEEISTLINEIQTDSEKALLNIDKGRQTAEEGEAMTKETEKSFHHIFQFIDYLVKDIDEISSASESLSKSSRSIASSVDNVVSISEETTAGVQEVTSTTDEQQKAVHELQAISENLRNLTVELKNSIEHFKI